MKNSEEPMDSTSGCTMGMARARGEGAEDRPHQRAHERGSQGTARLSLFRHGMAVDDGGGRDALARHARKGSR